MGLLSLQLMGTNTCIRGVTWLLVRGVVRVGGVNEVVLLRHPFIELRLLSVKGVLNGQNTQSFPPGFRQSTRVGRHTKRSGDHGLNINLGCFGLRRSSTGLSTEYVPEDRPPLKQKPLVGVHGELWLGQVLAQGVVVKR